MFGLLDRWLVPVPDPARRDWLCRHTYAHRGLHRPGVPENSLAAFAAAADRGFGIELDVRLSRDGEAIVFHDAELDRMTVHNGPIARRSRDELATIVLAGSRETIPSLGQVFDRIAGRVPILVEIKTRRNEHPADLCLAVDRELARYRGHCAVISFDPRVSRHFARRSPQVTRGLSFRVGSDGGIAGRARRRIALWSAKPDFLTCDIAGLPFRLGEAQRRRGLPLVAWTIVDARARAHAERFADAIIAEADGLE